MRPREVAEPRIGAHCGVGSPWAHRMPARLARIILSTTLVAAIAACGGADAPNDEVERRILDFDTATVRLIVAADTVPLALELAVSPAQKQLGLMERLHLESRAGMLFVYDSLQPANAGFWMYRTRIPLEIAFLDSTGVIRSTRVMEPCPTTIPQGCPTYEPGVPYQYALELAAGALQRLGADTGSRIVLEDLPDSVRSR